MCCCLCDPTFSRFSRTPTCDGQTDGRTDRRTQGHGLYRGCIASRGKKVGYGGKDLQKRKLLSLEWKSEGVMDDESGELMELMERLERLVRG